MCCFGFIKESIQGERNPLPPGEIGLPPGGGLLDFWNWASNVVIWGLEFGVGEIIWDLKFQGFSFCLNMCLKKYYLKNSLNAIQRDTFGRPLVLALTGSLLHLAFIIKIGFVVVNKSSELF